MRYRNPFSFHLTPGQASDLDGADNLLPELVADTGKADKGYDADERVVKPLQAQAKTVVIPPRGNRKHPRDYDKTLYKARHLPHELLQPNSSSTEQLQHALDQRVKNFLGAIYLAASVIWLN